MTTIQEIFLESDWDDLNQVRSAREQRAAQLVAQGFVCSYETLYRIHDGHRVLVLVAREPGSIDMPDHAPKKKIGAPRPRTGDRYPHPVERR